MVASASSKVACESAEGTASCEGMGTAVAELSPAKGVPTPGAPCLLGTGFPSGPESASPMIRLENFPTSNSPRGDGPQPCSRGTWGEVYTIVRLVRTLATLLKEASRRPHRGGFAPNLAWPKSMGGRNFGRQGWSSATMNRTVTIMPHHGFSGPVHAGSPAYRCPSHKR